MLYTATLIKDRKCASGFGGNGTAGNGTATPTGPTAIPTVPTGDASRSIVGGLPLLFRDWLLLRFSS